LELATTYLSAAIARSVEKIAYHRSVGLREECDRVAAAAQKSRAPALASVAASAALAADRLLPTIRSAAPPTAPLACADRCAACCSFPVALTVAEVQRIVRHLRTTLDENSLAELRERFRARAADRRALGLAVLRDRRPCPFLVDARCSIYSVRPLACRALASSDAAACERDVRARTETAPIYEPQRDLYLAFQLAIAEPLAQDGGPDLLELVAAIAIGIDLPFERYLDGRVWAAAEFRGRR
jgi:Fe-S-cluster containining protein